MLLLIRRYLLIKKQVVFQLEKLGVTKIKKLGLNLPKDITYLTHDFIGIIDGLTELKYYDRVNDDIDDIKNKQIRCIGELLHQIFIVCKKSLLEDATMSNSQKLNLELETYSDPDEWIIDPRPLTYSIKEFF
jgi:DNA-directed RNA polymerase beta subunit